MSRSLSEGNLEAQSHVSLQEASRHRKGQRKSIMQTSMAESLKLRQMRAKAFREQQRNRIDGRHKHLFAVVAEVLKLEPGAVEEFMLDGDQVCIVHCMMWTLKYNTSL